MSKHRNDSNGIKADSVHSGSRFAFATILLCFFTFSGCYCVVGNSASRAQIELACFVDKRNKRTSAFKIASRKNIRTWLGIRWMWIHASLVQLVRAIRTQFKHNCKVVLTFAGAPDVLSFLFTHRNSEELIPVPSLG
jgi:hypothetical protein